MIWKFCINTRNLDIDVDLACTILVSNLSHISVTFLAIQLNVFDYTIHLTKGSLLLFLAEL